MLISSTELKERILRERDHSELTMENAELITMTLEVVLEIINSMEREVVFGSGHRTIEKRNQRTKGRG